MAAGSTLVVILPRYTAKATEMSDEPDWVVISAAIAIIAALGSVAARFL